jgi:hypothetical protein
MSCTPKQVRPVVRRQPSGQLTLRADSGFWSAKVLATCRRPRHPPVGHRTPDPTVAAAIAAIDEQAWADIDHPNGGQAQVAETTLGSDRLIVRRTRLIGPQARPA